MTTYHADIIAVRLYVAAADTTEANATRRAIQSIVNKLATSVRSDEPSQYWKVPELFEVFVTFSPCERIAEPFDQVLTELGSGWLEHRFVNGGNWAVWNPGAGSRFALPAVHWAHVECARDPDDDRQEVEHV